MIRVRRVDDVAIIDWSHKDVATVVPRIRALVEAREANRVLLNMREVETLKGEGLETLTEALSVCEDKGCTLAMFGLNTYLTKLLDIMGLHEVMPRDLGAEETGAVSAVKKMQADGAVLEAELDFEAQESKDESKEAVVEFEFDAPEAKPQATTKKAAAAPASAMPPTIKFDPNQIKAAAVAAAGAPSGGDDDLLAISWVDVTAQGIHIGGPGAREIVAALDAGASAKTQPLSPQQIAGAVARPTAKLPPSKAQELEIEIEDAPSKPREFKTEVIQAFELKPEVREAAERAISGDGEGLEVDFEPVSADQVGLGQPAAQSFMQGSESKGLFGGGEQEEGSDWSPVDTEPRRPPTPPAGARIPAAQPPAQRPAPQPAPPPSPRPAQPQPQATPPQRPAQPAHPQQPAQRPAAAPAARATPAQPQHAPASPHHPAQPPHAPPVQQQPVAAAVPVAAPQPAPAPGYGGMDAGDETVMFQADGLLAEVLAAVSAEATAPAPAPTVEPVAPPVAAAPVAAPSKPDGVAAPAKGLDGADELRQFLNDYALVTELHLRVLEKFSRDGVEKVLGRPEVQSAVGGSAAAISSIIEDFVQARLLRRRRSPRIRGGTGFLYAPSPKTRSAVTRLLRRYEDGNTRAEVMTWVQSARKASEK